MELVQSFWRNPFIKEYLNPKQLHVTPWVLDPNGLSHPFVFEFEQRFFDKVYAANIYEWMNKWWWLSIVYSIIYVILIYYGRSLMESRERFELRIPLILWNLGLALFSIFGVLRCVPEMLFSLHQEGLQYTICDRSNIHGITGYWCVLVSYLSFLVSRLFYLGSRYFVSRKSPSWSIRYLLFYASRN